MKRKFRIQEILQITVYSYVDCYTKEEAEAIFNDGGGSTDINDIIREEWISADDSTIEEVT